MKILVLSHALPGTGGFEWVRDTKENRPIIEQAYLDEIECWDTESVKVRLLRVRTPRRLKENLDITDWLDDNLDGLEYKWKALKEHGKEAYDKAMDKELRGRN